MTSRLSLTSLAPVLLFLCVAEACGPPPPARQGLLDAAGSLGVDLTDPACSERRPNDMQRCRRIVENGTISLTELSTGHYRVQRFWSFPDEPPWHRVRDSLETAFAAAKAVPFSCGALDTQPLPSYVVSRAAWYRSPYVAVLLVALRKPPRAAPRVLIFYEPKRQVAQLGEWWFVRSGESHYVHSFTLATSVT
jgi:hypothetical protein